MAIIFVLVGSSLISGVGAPEEVDTSAAISEISDGNVDTATITDRDQILELVLKNGETIRSTYVTGQGIVLQELLQTEADSGALPGGP